MHRQIRRPTAFTLVELLVVISVIAVLAVAVVPAVNSLSKSGGRKAAVSNLLGALEQARSLAIKDGVATYVVFPDQIPSGSDPNLAQRYDHRSYAVFEEDPNNAAVPKQITPWRTLPTGISIRSGSLNYLANSISFPFAPANTTAPFRFLKFTSNGEIDPSSTPSASSGTIQFGIFEGSVSAGNDIATSANKNMGEMIEVARLTGRAKYAP